MKILSKDKKFSWSKAEFDLAGEKKRMYQHIWVIICFMRYKSFKLETGKSFLFPCLDVSAPWVRHTLCLEVAATNPTHTSTQKNSGTASTLCGSRHMAAGLRPARILLVQSLFPSIYKGLCGHTAGKTGVEAPGDQGRGAGGDRGGGSADRGGGSRG